MQFTIYIRFEFFLSFFFGFFSGTPFRPNMQCGTPRNPASCENFLCKEKGWAACPKCWCFLCFEHFTLSDDCLCHNITLNVDNAFSLIPFNSMTTSSCATNDQGITLATGGAENSKDQIVAETETRNEEVGDRMLTSLKERRDFEDQIMTEAGQGDLEDQEIPLLEEMIDLNDQEMTSGEASGENLKNQASKDTRKGEGGDQGIISMEARREDVRDRVLTSIERIDFEDQVMAEVGRVDLEDQVIPLIEEIIDINDQEIASVEAGGESQASTDAREGEGEDHVMISTEAGRAEETDSSDIPENHAEASLPNGSAEHIHLSPESFEVDGERAFEVPSQQTVKKSKNLVVKEKRNAGYSYESEKSKKLMPARRFADYKSSCNKCNSRGLGCSTLSRADREAIRTSFFDLGALRDQREWIGRHIQHTQEEKPKKLRKFAYYLPNSRDAFRKVPVCRAMFLATLGISERQVKTVLAKKQPCGLIEGERRGGRKTSEKDARLRDGVKRHIDRFPRQESHYCRASSRCEYLSEDLNPEIMYRMYQSTTDECASLSLYRKVLKEMKIKFHHPKKDTCPLCETYRRGNPQQKEEIVEAYKSHIAEKEKVRELKSIAKDRASVDPTFVSAVFDLEQVIYLPKSPQSQIFYKRRLSNFNFTVYELASRDGWCFLSHEGETRRGSCEIASYLHRYLCSLDERGVKQVEFYCDGCTGQNKNSIIPTMLQHFIDKAKSVQSVTVRYFPTNHGQSEGDAMHSVIERNVRRLKEVMVPAQLTTICKMARLHPRPYHVIEVQSKDIDDWKSAGQQKGILRIRTSEGGQNVDWKKFMAIKILKGEVNSIYFKYSHTDQEFDVIRTDRLRRRDGEISEVTPQRLYENGPPKIPHGKYQDLQALCSGTTPVVWHPDHQAFYRLLPH